MYKNVWKEDENNKIQKYFLILYQGLKTKHFYWEFVNSSRKVLILIAFVIPKDYQILFSATVLISTWRLQEYLKPYKDNVNNRIEILGVNVGIITLSCGLIFNSNNTREVLNTILLAIMLFFNALFITQWSYLFLLTLGEKHPFFLKVSFA